ncbi:MAG: M56 family metallopeptidase [Myxococcota bacterium]
MEWVLTYAVHSTALIAAVWLLTSVIPKLSLGTREALWKVALLGPLATATVVTVVGVPSVWGSLSMPSALRTEPVVAAPTPAPAPGPASDLAVSEAQPRGPVVERRIVRHRSGELEITAVRQRRPRAASVSAVAAPVPAGPSQSSSWPWVLLGLWGLGAALALGRLGWAALRLRKQLEGRRDVIEDPVLESFLDLCGKAGLKKRPRLTASSHLRSPIALGRREICLPERAVDSLSPPQQRDMLAHEMAHLLRHDPSWMVLVAVIEAVFFFQPLNHLARRKIQEVAEFQCDDWAAQQAGTGVHLAKCLAEVAGWVEDGPPMTPVAVTMAERGSPIVRRITRLLHERRGGGRVHPAGRVALALGSLGLLIAAVPGVTQARAFTGSERIVATAEPAELALRSVIVEDRSDDGHDRSRVYLQTDDETVEIEVQAPRPAPLPPPAPERDHADVMIFGYLSPPWAHLWSHPWSGSVWWGDLLHDFEHHHERARERALERAERARERAVQRAERARERAERHRERLERHRERLEREIERRVERQLDSEDWPTIFGVLWRGRDTHDEPSRVVEL